MLASIDPRRDDTPATARCDAATSTIWTARQLALISAPIDGDETAELPDGRPTFAEAAVVSGTVVYDELDEHTYVRTAAFDHAARPVSMTLPSDPDWDPAGMDGSPVIAGALEYDRRGLPARALLTVGDLAPIPVVAAIDYLRDGLVSHIEYGDLGGGARAVESDTDYDIRRRPVRMTSTRAASPAALDGELGEVTVIHDQRLDWDRASNLTGLVDDRDPSEWPDGFRPQTVEITHDSLYRVVGALFHYSTEDSDDADDTASDWRDEAAASNAVDPMRPVPAEMVGTASTGTRVRSLTWEWDWLGNMTEWTDDAQQFYERSIGDITNGQPIGARPSALYVADNLTLVDDGTGGWVEVEYGDGGNVERLTVHGECAEGANPEAHGTGRVAELSAGWICQSEQHFEYRWDELDRIVEARRWDRDGGPLSSGSPGMGGGNWTFEARQRYRYDGANQRTIKESFDTHLGDSRVALYIYPGDYERRGLVRGSGEYESLDDGLGGSITETQYLVAGARLVWDHQGTGGAMGALDRNRRLTMGVTDLIGTTAASVDLLSGELLEVSTYYPNGARETLRTAETSVPLEPMGFTGKEADEDVGLVYFGERYLLARLGRWASPDPLHVHASGGGEALNSYHYVSGNLLQARDPLGLDPRTASSDATVSHSSAGSGRQEAAAPMSREWVPPAHGRRAPDADERVATANPYDDHLGEGPLAPPATIGPETGCTSAFTCDLQVLDTLRSDDEPGLSGPLAVTGLLGEAIAGGDHEDMRRGAVDGAEYGRALDAASVAGATASALAPGGAATHGARMGRAGSLSPGFTLGRATLTWFPSGDALVARARQLADELVSLGVHRAAVRRMAVGAAISRDGTGPVVLSVSRRDAYDAIARGRITLGPDEILGDAPSVNPSSGRLEPWSHVEHLSVDPLVRMGATGGWVGTVPRQCSDCAEDMSGSAWIHTNPR